MLMVMMPMMTMVIMVVIEMMTLMIIVILLMIVVMKFIKACVSMCVHNRQLYFQILVAPITEDELDTISYHKVSNSSSISKSYDCQTGAAASKYGRAVIDGFYMLTIIRDLQLMA